MTPREKIRRLRKDRGLLIRQLAKNAGVSESRLASLLKTDGKNGPSVTIAIGIADALGVDVRWLWTDADWPPVKLVRRRKGPRNDRNT